MLWISSDVIIISSKLTSRLHTISGLLVPLIHPNKISSHKICGYIFPFVGFCSRDIEGDSILYVFIRLGTGEGMMSFILYPYYCRLNRIELGVPKGGVPMKLYMIASPTKSLFAFWAACVIL